MGAALTCIQRPGARIRLPSGSSVLSSCDTQRSRDEISRSTTTSGATTSERVQESGGKPRLQSCCCCRGEAQARQGIAEPEDVAGSYDWRVNRMC